MNIQPINSSTLNFNGKIITKGKWPAMMETAFELNPEIEKLASGKFNIIGKVSCRKPFKDDMYHYENDRLYKLSIIAIPEKATLIDKIKYLFGMLPKIKLCHDYHSSATMIDLMNERIKFDSYKKRLGI